MGDPTRGAAWEEPGPGETTDTVPRLHVATAVHGLTEQERSAKLQDKKDSTVVNLGISPKYADKNETINIVKRLQSNT